MADPRPRASRVSSETAERVAAEALEKAERALALNEETNRMVREVHAAMLAPLPGYSKSFVERASEWMIEAEAGRIIGSRIIFYAKILGALGAIGAAFAAAVHWGQSK
jgi:hypothetical protein